MTGLIFAGIVLFSIQLGVIIGLLFRLAGRVDILTQLAQRETSEPCYKE